MYSGPGMGCPGMTELISTPLPPAELPSASSSNPYPTWSLGRGLHKSVESVNSGWDKTWANAKHRQAAYLEAACLLLYDLFLTHIIQFDTRFSGVGGCHRRGHTR